MSQPLSPSSLFLFIFLISNATSLLSSSSDIDPRYKSCISPSSDCVSPLQITYPFYERGLHEYCGHPGFALDCQGTDLILQMSSYNYTIIGINYNSNILSVADSELTGGPCTDPTFLHNSTLDSTWFNYTSNDKNITLFYDCSPFKPDLNEPFQITCPQDYISSNAIQGAVYFATNDERERDLNGRCGVKVYATLFNATWQGLADGSVSITSSSVGDALSQGFEIAWNIDRRHCDVCTDSGGVCGFNSTTDVPTCFCKDGPHPQSCPKPRDFKAVIGIGVGVGFGAILILSIVVLFYVRGFKRNDPPPKMLGKDLSSLPSMNSLTSTYFGVHLFSYTELEEATDYFSPSKELGEGGFGSVYHGKLKDEREVAIKRLYDNNTRRAEQFMNEVEILADLRHPNLVTLYGCTSRHSRYLLLVYEYVPNGTVADHLHGASVGSLGSPLQWSLRLRIAVETASALAYLHSSDVVHRDVKTRNILLDQTFSVKVADFGLSRLFPFDATHVSTAPQGTPGYLDPEYHQCYQLTEKSDVYSFGVMLAELVSSKPAVDITRPRHEINLSSMAINRIQASKLDDFVDPGIGFESDIRVRQSMTAVAELAFGCLQPTREERPSMEDVLERLRKIQEEYNEGEKAEVMDVPVDDVKFSSSPFSSPHIDGSLPMMTRSV